MKKLTGTEKQIEWAEKIRKAAIDSVERLIKDTVAKYPVDQREAAEDTASKVMDKLLSQSEAVFWINNRHYSDYAEYLIGFVDIVSVTKGVKQTAENWYKIGLALIKTNK